MPTYQELKNQIAALKSVAVEAKTQTDPIGQPILTRRKMTIPFTGRPPKYPWRYMGVNQSFLVPCKDSTWARQRVMNSLTSCATLATKRYGRKFTMRRDPDKKGVRVWRIA